MRVDKFNLYKSVKYQVENFSEDIGYTLPELWAIIKGNSTNSLWWKNICMKDYGNKE